MDKLFKNSVSQKAEDLLDLHYLMVAEKMNQTGLMSLIAGVCASASLAIARLTDTDEKKDLS